MFLSLEKNIFKISAIVLVNVAVIQLFSFFYLLENYQKDYSRCRETAFVSTAFVENSPGKIENNLKKIDSSIEKEISDLNTLSDVNFIYLEDVERGIQIKQLYELEITNKINLLQLISNHLGQRSPPSLLS